MYRNSNPSSPVFNPLSVEAGVQAHSVLKFMSLFYIGGHASSMWVAYLSCVTDVWLAYAKY